ncbi:acyltransferase [Leifsonia sp. PS1209]|uniref:acyltransferase family protein n=1 Tax=Leifsonia sp. PS1209 TaxID=2724914 RepID=UPI001442BBF8|nr:acyltransferase [Leifsonia sp. PS1209]QIZ98428.1 acyltransferase [Leifsonia sp. PS1209]
MTIFDPRQNSIGFLRLLFATLVIVEHAWPLGGFGTHLGRTENNVGFLCVEGFFALSGFLITRSASRQSTGRYLWHRILRIFPAYWVCLLVIAVVFAPIVWRTGHSLWRYFTATPTAVGYVLNNSLLSTMQQGIGGTLASNPFPNLWNGPLYTLYYEFICYLVVGGLAALGVLNAKTVLTVGAGVWVWLQLIEVGAAGVVDNRQATLTVCFMVGSLAWFLREKVLTKSAGLVIGVCAILVAGLTYVTLGFHQVGIIAFAFACIWAGCVLPFRKVGVKRDFSYGMYIYGWPVLQIGAFFGLQKLGLPLYLASTLVVTLGLAAASWYVIESKALRLKGASAPRWLVGEPRLESDPSSRRGEKGVATE